MEKVKNFQRNYLESEKFFSKFSYSYFLERENFQNRISYFLERVNFLRYLNLKVKIFKKKISTKLLKVKNIPERENFQNLKVMENFQNLKVIEIEKIKIKQNYLINLE